MAAVHSFPPSLCLSVCGMHFCGWLTKTPTPTYLSLLSRSHALPVVHTHASIHPWKEGEYSAVNFPCWSPHMSVGRSAWLAGWLAVCLPAINPPLTTPWFFANGRGEEGGRLGYCLIHGWMQGCGVLFYLGWWVSACVWVCCVQCSTLSLRSSIHPRLPPPSPRPCLPVATTSLFGLSFSSVYGRVWRAHSLPLCVSVFLPVCVSALSLSLWAIFPPPCACFYPTHTFAIPFHSIVLSVCVRGCGQGTKANAPLAHLLACLLACFLFVCVLIP